MQKISVVKKSLRLKFTHLLLAAATAALSSCGGSEANTAGTNTAVSGISLGKATLALFVGETYTLKAVVSADNATDQPIIWATSDSSKSIVTNGKIVALSEGAVTISVRQGDLKDSCVVAIYAISDDVSGITINGVRWATRNVSDPSRFADTPETLGLFYQWNRKVGWSATDPLTPTPFDSARFWDSTTPIGTAWSADSSVCPSGWRIPTRDEQALLVSTGSVWTTINGVIGCVFGGYEKALFLPAAGMRGVSVGGLYSAGLYGYYWSSTDDGAESAYGLIFSRRSAEWGSLSHSVGLAVRCVEE